MKINLIIEIIFMFYNLLLVYGQATDSIRIEKIAGPNYLSEGPHWDVINKVLYFVDIPRQRVYCFNPETNKTTSTYIKNGPVGVVVPVAEKKNSFIAGSGTDLVQVTWDPKTDNENPDIKVLTKVDVNKNVTRFNDGKVDPMGRFWAGTMGQAGGVLYPNEGTLYKFEAHYTPVAILNETSISNGLTWSHDNKTFYWIDTPTDNIYRFDYNMESGNITKKRVIFNLSENSVPGHPDGMTIDKNGNLWVACYNGKRVIQIDPNTGKLLRQIEMPVDQITSLAFGGTNLDILYVTSGRENLNEQQIAKQPMAGSVFAIYNIGAVGIPMLDCRYVF
ncbi:regucalcin-like [Aphidius gifuensis]|uniref:regucalcin-like n=1 Tax=Aphidius gifuensis TaxID=684658 RepID=UPI001CDBA380|nr:regucalcin-like [Aphidius gifuensis]